MPYKLKGRNVLVTGGSRGLGALICHKFANEGCNIAINYHSGREAADELAQDIEKKYGVRSVCLQGDAGNLAECARVVHDAIDAFGGLDIIIGNAGWTRFSKFGDLDDMTEEEWDKCWAVNVKGQMALLRAALPTFNSNPDGGCFIITSSVAGVTPSGSSMPYSITKAAGLHLMKCLANTQGPKIRVNAVLPGLLLTEWGQKYSPDRIKMMEDKAALKTVTDLDDCANAYVMVAMNSSMTGEKIRVDAGLFVEAA